MSQAESAAPSRWLAVIDLQRVFADPASPWAIPTFATLLPAVQALVESHLPRVVFTRFVAPEVPQGAWVAYYQQWPFALVSPDDELYDLVPELPPALHPVLTRTTFGKWDAELAGLVGLADELVLAGVSTDCCVLSMALAAADAGRRVRVAADACAAPTQADSERALAAMALYGPLIEVTTAAAILAG